MKHQKWVQRQNETAALLTWAQEEKETEMTIQSFTSEKEYETTLDDCECDDHIYRNRVCKHMEALRRAYERARRAAFNELCYQFDVRSETVKAARREAYCREFQIYG